MSFRFICILSFSCNALKHVSTLRHAARLTNTSDVHGSVSDEAAQKVFKHFDGVFDLKMYNQIRSGFAEGALALEKNGTEVRAGYATHAPRSSKPHCDKRDTSPQVLPLSVTTATRFPGGILSRIPPDFSATLMAVVNKAPQAAGNIALPLALSMQALQLGMGLVQTMAAGVIHTVPPLIPPPMWINMPLPCAPMITGHNCFGAVLYPITMADFIVADMTDKVIDGILAAFPETYADKVGKTNDAMYKSCGAAFFSMHCSAIFPRCTLPLSRDEAIPIGGRVPLCFHLCIIPLVTCPGFWIFDVFGTCLMVSVPPMCTQAVFWNLWRIPPQYATFDEANLFPEECPDDDFKGIDAGDDPSLYDDTQQAPSPILEFADDATKIKDKEKVASLAPLVGL